MPARQAVIRLPSEPTKPNAARRVQFWRGIVVLGLLAVAAAIWVATTRLEQSIGTPHGDMTDRAITLGFDRSALSRALPRNQAIIANAMAALEVDGAEQARIALFGADRSDPVVAYAEAVIDLNENVNDTVPAQRLLHSAADAGVPEALVLIGELTFRMAVWNDRLPSTDLMRLNGGVPEQASRLQLERDAVEAWAAAAVLGSTEAMRLLAMAEARAIGGPQDLAAALSLWEAAAAGGDAIAAFEAATMYVVGTVVEQDVARALSLYRTAVALNFVPANLGLATVLAPWAQAGDVAAAQEAMAVLEAALGEDLILADRRFAESLLGVYLAELAPEALRDRTAAVDHWIAAVEAGDYPTAARVADAYQSGNGRQRDIAMAYAYFDIARHAGVERAGEAMAAIAPQLTEAELQRALSRVNDIRSSVEFMTLVEELEATPGVRMGPLQPIQ